MGCLDVSFERIGGDLEVRIQRIGGDLDVQFRRVDEALAVSFSPVCGTDAALSLLASSDPSLLTEEDEQFISVNQNE